MLIHVSEIENMTNHSQDLNSLNQTEKKAILEFLLSLVYYAQAFKDDINEAVKQYLPNISAKFKIGSSVCNRLIGPLFGLNVCADFSLFCTFDMDGEGEKQGRLHWIGEIKTVDSKTFDKMRPEIQEYKRNQSPRKQREFHKKYRSQLGTYILTYGLGEAIYKDHKRANPVLRDDVHDSTQGFLVIVDRDNKRIEMLSEELTSCMELVGEEVLKKRLLSCDFTSTASISALSAHAPPHEWPLGFWAQGLRFEESGYLYNKESGVFSKQRLERLRWPP